VKIITSVLSLIISLFINRSKFKIHLGFQLILAFIWIPLLTTHTISDDFTGLRIDESVINHIMVGFEGARYTEHLSFYIFSLFTIVSFFIFSYLYYENKKRQFFLLEQKGSKGVGIKINKKIIENDLIFLLPFSWQKKSNIKSCRSAEVQYKVMGENVLHHPRNTYHKIYKIKIYEL